MGNTRSTDRRVVVTGIGIASPCGTGVEKAWDALVHGRSGIGPITRFDASCLETRFAGEVRDFEPEEYLDRKQVRRMDRFQQLAMAAAELTMRDAGYAVNAHDAERAAVIVGSGVAGLVVAETEHTRAQQLGPGAVSPFFILHVLANMAPAQIAIRHGFKGPNWSTNSACATSAHAIGEALRLIQRGDVDVALAGGAEAPLGMMGIAAFNAIRALSTRNEEPERASRPFDVDRDGFVMSEGAAILLLEEIGHAMDRGARIYAELVGYGASSDAHHLIQPAPGHEGGQRCMRAALRDAGLEPGDVDYVNAHAASTPIGDVLEIEAIKAVFGEHAYRMPISSSKSITGHLMGAAGAAEASIAALALARGVIPPTINIDNLDPRIDLDCVPNVARRARLDVVMSNSFGFGGTNVTLILRRLDSAAS
ncbi:MAG: beta-ketoacyl-ACP synthase II [Gemmatimonadetes bacterium]|nr:beta-ketoacyl-ACP synthase II [Gemmatimonadota bacterium]